MSSPLVTGALAAFIEAALFVICLVWQFRTRRYTAAAYWAVVFASFALGTALGDFTATALHLGYLASGILFLVVILIPAVARKYFGLNSVVAFWFGYVVTRPLGASFADWLSKPRSLSGASYGDGPVALAITIIVAILVGYLAVARNGIQPPVADQAGRSAAVNDGVVGR